MNNQTNKPLEDKVYVVVLEMDCDGYDVAIRTYATKELAVQAMQDWYDEEWNYWLDNDRSEDDLDVESFIRDDRAYLTDIDNFWYTWTIREEVIKYE